jgi:hypothetical protein
VIVDDVTAPVPTLETLPTITGECSTEVTAPTATDNCEGTITGTTTNPTSYTEQGTYTITWTFDDANGNTSTQTQTVIVDDVTAPVPTVETLPTITGECSAEVTAPTATDNCEGTITGTTTDPTSYTEQGTYTITWTFDDGNGNTSTQTQAVIVDDVAAPVPTVETLPTITGECSAEVTAPTATDNCEGVITGTTTDPTSFSEQGTYTITWIFDDGNGNTAEQTQTVTVKDETAPVPTLETLPTITGECSAEVTTPTATDNCEGTITGTTTDPTSYTEQGTYTITWTYDDGNGKTSTQTQTVIVNDVTAPVLSVPEDLTISLEPGQSQIEDIELGVAIATDNCTNVTISNNAPSSYQIGTTVIIWIAEDLNGNRTEKTQIVTVVESSCEINWLLNPNIQIKLNSNGLGSLNISQVDFGTSSSCGPITLSLDRSEFNCGDLGIQKVSVIATDNSGTVATREVEVSVVDQIRPNLKLLLSSFTWFILKGQNYVLPDLRFLAFGSDNCSFEIQQSPSPGTAYTKSGNIQVRLTATDPSGNKTQSTLVVRLRVLSFRSFFGLKIEENSDNSMIQVPWNTSIEAIKKDYLGIDDESLGKVLIEQSEFNSLIPGFYSLTISNRLNESELGENEIPLNILVLDKPLPQDIRFSEQFIPENLSRGQRIGSLSTLDASDTIHSYELIKNDQLELRENQLIWKGGPVPAILKFQVSSTDRAGQTISREIALTKELKMGEFLIFPNPAEDHTQILVELDQPAQVSLRVFDATGRMVISDQFVREETFIQTLDLMGIAQGMYTVQVQVGQMVMTGRLIKK